MGDEKPFLDLPEFQEERALRAKEIGLRKRISAAIKLNRRLGHMVDRDAQQDADDAQIHAAALTEMLIKKGIVTNVDFLEALCEVYERAAREGL